MIVYVESNFVLELAYRQEQYRSCEALLGLAESGRIMLVLPAFAIAEPYSSLARRFAERRSMLDRFEVEVKELSRSEPYAEMRKRSDELTALIARSRDEEKERLDAATLRVLRCAESIPLDAAVLERAIELQKGSIGSAQDALVFASVATDLEAKRPGVSCFVNKNARDFAAPEVQRFLDDRKCKMLAKFPDGAAFVENELKKAAG